VVASIDGKEEAAGARYIESKVYRTPDQPNSALGELAFPKAEKAIGREVGSATR